MDAQEFNQRFMPFHRLLYRVAYHTTGNQQDAEDLLQDTYLKLWTKRDDLPPDAQTEAYLITLMRNLYRDQRRLKRIETIDVDPHSIPLPIEGESEGGSSAPATTSSTSNRRASSARTSL